MQRVQVRSVVVGLLVAAAASASVGCKDQEKCDQALETARKAMKDEFLDMALARQWREHAGKECGVGTELDALDKEILEKEAALIKAVEDKAKAEAEAGQKALDKSATIWAKFDKLDDKEKDEAALKKTAKKADKLAKGLAPDYAKQVKKYNKEQNKKRLKKLEDK